MFALLAESIILDAFKRLGYWGPFLVLVGAGAGLPVPEEVTLTGSGYLLYRGQVALFPIIATCWVATLIGDSIPFWLGRLLGPKALKIPLFARALHPERFALIEEKVRTHGGWAVFTARFLPGLRLPCFFTAGTARMSYGRFIFHDAAGAALMVPMYVLLGQAFGTKIGVLERTVQNSTETLGFILLLGLAFAGVRMMSRRRDRQAAALEDPECDKTDVSGEILPETTSSSPIEPPQDSGATG